MDVGLSDDPTGAACEYFNIGAQMAWKNKGGDWIDARGEEQGQQPFAATTRGTGPNQSVTWDVTALAKSAAPDARRFSFLIRQLPGPQGNAEFHSREASDLNGRPNLVLRFADGAHDLLTPSADATLDCSAKWGIGDVPALQVSGNRNFVIEFTTRADLRKKKVVEAKLVLVTTARNTSASLLGVYRLHSPGVDTASVVEQEGLAARYPNDAGLGRDPDVIFTEDFETSDWLRHWTYAADTHSFDTVDSDIAQRFQALQGKALRVVVRKGELTGLNMGFNFKPKTGKEPEEIYFRYYLRLADDFNPIDGGKLPGPSGTYDRAGWGGRRPDGTNGWSARGAWALPAGKGNPLDGFFPLATQISVPNIPDDKANLYWLKGRRGLLQRNRWYCLEHYVRMNTPGRADGIIADGWMDISP